uniref:Uncharacterized protein n=1 Tax=Amphilophus citrinellus TaxID=61819 RepID=A0A3Q0SSF8_AMPCI
MKPIPRITRTKYYHRLNNEPEGSDKVVCKWHREEKKKLVIAMKRLNTRTAGGKTNIDSAFLRKYVPNRSISEVGFKLKKKRREEKNARKPIEEWTHVAASLAGTLEETISTAFSQSTSSSATSLTSVPSSVSSTVASTSSAISSPTPHTLPQSTSAKECHARFGRTSKYATKDSPRTFGVKCVVDFEKIYCFLSVIQKPSQDCHLTPMESAIVLDLLMSLPEELPLLDCKKLRKHMIQVQPAAYSKSLALRNQTVTSNKADSQSSQSYNTSTELEDSNVMPPPLNPFIVPLTLLKRRQEEFNIT